MGFATTVLRVVTGATMAGHGIQKLTHALGGHGPEATGKAFENMGFTPGRHFGMVTGIAETAGGSMMTLGLGVPVACSMVSGVMIGAIAKVHYKNGYWVTDGGFEYNLNILAATFAVAGAGGGALALDGLRGKKHRGLGWALAQLALGASAAAGALVISERQAPSRAGQFAAEPEEEAGTQTNGQTDADGSSMVDLSGDENTTTSSEFR